MNEEEWRKEYSWHYKLFHYPEEQKSNRKLRLLACAFCRKIEDLLNDHRSRRALDVAERYADGQATEMDRRKARKAALAVSEPAWDDAYARSGASEIEASDWIMANNIASNLVNAADYAATAASAVAHRVVDVAVDHAARNASSALAARAGYRYMVFSSNDGVDYKRLWDENAEILDAEQAKICLVMEEVLGNPLRLISLDPAWLTPITKAFAQSIYEDRRFSELPILADALEKAGCHSQEVLDHCRSGPHVRGCWALDLILGKS